MANTGMVNSPFEADSEGMTIPVLDGYTPILAILANMGYLAIYPIFGVYR